MKVEFGGLGFPVLTVWFQSSESMGEGEQTKQSKLKDIPKVRGGGQCYRISRGCVDIAPSPLLPSLAILNVKFDLFSEGIFS